MRKLLFVATLLAVVCAARADEPAADAPDRPIHHGTVHHGDVHHGDVHHGAVHHGAVHHGAVECECEFSYEMILPPELRQALDTAQSLLKACCPVECEAGKKCEAAAGEIHGIQVLHGVIGNDAASQCATECNTKCASECRCQSQCKCETACQTSCQSNCTAECKRSCGDHCAAQCSKSCGTACKDSCHGHAHCGADCQTACGTCNSACNTACSEHCHSACGSHCCCESGCQNHPGQGRAVLLRFEAPWCGPCQAMTRQVFEHPHFKQALGQHCAVIRINIDDQPELAKRFGINALPTCVVVTPHGKVIEKVVGAQGGEAFLNRIRAAIGVHAHRPHAGGCPFMTSAPSCGSNGKIACGTTNCPACRCGESCRCSSSEKCNPACGCASRGPASSQVLHNPYYIRDDVQYFPAPPQVAIGGCPCMAKSPDYCATVGTSNHAAKCPACKCGSSCSCAPGKTCNAACSCGGPRVGTACMVTTGASQYQGVLRRIDTTWVVIESADGVHWIPSRGVECISVPSESAPGPTNQVHQEPKSDPFGPGIPSGFRVYSVAVTNADACRQLRAGDRVDLQFEAGPYCPPVELKRACVFAISSSIGTDESNGVQLSLLLTPQQCQQVQSICKPGHPFCCRVVSVSLDKPRSGLIWSFDETGDLLVDHKWKCPAGHEGCVACPPQAPSSDDVHVAPPSLNTSPAQYLEEHWARIPPPNPVYVPQPPQPVESVTPDVNTPQAIGAPTLPQPWRSPKVHGSHDHGSHRVAHGVDETRQFLVQAQLTEAGNGEEAKIISCPQVMTVAGQPARVEIDNQFKLEMNITPSSRHEGLLEVTVIDGCDESLRSVASIRSGDAFKLRWSGPPQAERWLECKVMEVEGVPAVKQAEYHPEPPPLDPVPPQPTPSPAPQHHVAVYAVADLVVKGEDGQPDFAPLLKQIKTQVAPESWSDDGGSGLIHPFVPNLSIVVRQTPDVHAQLGEYLDQQREKNYSRTVRFETLVPGFRRPAPTAPEWEALPAPPIAPRPIAPPPKRPAPPAPPELLPPR